MSAAGAALAARRALGVVVRFRPIEGGVDREFAVADLADCWQEPFERFLPVRALVSYRGQRNFTGLWWCATSGSHVGFESWLERDHLMLQDFSREVVAISSQPCMLEVTTPSGVRRHTPDYFARLADGTGVMIDVRPDARVAGDAAVFAATAAACESVGWRYERLGEIDPLLAANVRWLAGYRHPRCLNPVSRDRLLALATVDERVWSVGSLARAVGEAVTVLPSLFHLLWSGALCTELRSAPLHPSSPVWSAAR